MFPYEHLCTTLETFLKTIKTNNYYNYMCSLDKQYTCIGLVSNGWFYYSELIILLLLICINILFLILILHLTVWIKEQSTINEWVPPPVYQYLAVKLYYFHTVVKLFIN